MKSKKKAAETPKPVDGSHEIEQFSFFYRPKDDSGSIHLLLADGKAADIFLDSSPEASFLLNLLSHHKPCFWHPTTGQISTGLEQVGDEE